MNKLRNAYDLSETEQRDLFGVERKVPIPPGDEGCRPDVMHLVSDDRRPLPTTIEGQHGSLGALFPRLRVQHEEVAPVEEVLVGDGGTVSVEPGKHPDDEDAFTPVEVVACDDSGVRQTAPFAN